MRNQCLSVVLLTLFSLTYNSEIFAQLKKENFKVGISYGTGSQNKYPFNLSSYTHTVTFYKAVVNYKFSERGRWTFETNLEPSYNIAEHQLLNKYFIKPTYPDYLEKQALFTQKRTIREYVVNAGMIARFRIYKTASIYALGSVGPMYTDKETERLAKGFAFSDIFGLGLSYGIDRIRLDARCSVRHTSNLNTQRPNNGHNTTNIEFSVLYNL